MINNKKNQKEKKYTKLLNNLLNIANRDSSILTRKSNHNLDLFVIFKNKIKDVEKIFVDQSFTLEITLHSLTNLIEKLKEMKWEYDNYDDKLLFGQKIKIICEEYDYKLTKILLNGLLLPKEVKATLEEIIEKLEIKKQKFIKEWMKYKKEIEDEIHEKGSSPFHIGTCFLKGTNDFYSFNAPLFFKEINIEVLEKENTVKIFSNSNWKINEKLNFYLEKMGYHLPNIEDIDEKELLVLIKKTIATLQIEAPTNISFFLDKFENLKKEDITNKKIKINSGVVMGWFNPEGGYLRKLMQQIIENNEIENIINTNPEKKIYESKIMSELENNYENLIKIQENNFSQDRALASALVQDTIIWGPPGTGKSQVITNIIANILYQNKSAIVMSQKKPALDVLKKRLGILSKFLLFTFDSKNMKKADFYMQLNEFIQKIESFNDYSNYYYKNNNSLISKNQIIMLEKINQLKKINEYDSIVESLNLYGNNFKKMKLFSSLNLNYSYPLINNSDEKLFLDKLANWNNINKNGYIFWWKYNDKFIKDSKDAFTLAKEYQIADLEKYLNPFRKTKLDNIYLIAENAKILDSKEKKDFFESDELYLENCLAKRITEKIHNWNLFEPNKIKLYQKFASAIRASRRLPNKFMSDHMAIILELFPIIVTTPEQIFRNFNKNHFDYAIVDEASQIFLEVGLPILYLSKIKIVAGDQEQMKPTSWFSTREGDIADQYDEEDVEENAISLLDYVKDKGVNEVLLNQNYRADTASLMSFSAKEYYKSNLEVIDKIDKNKTNSIEVIQINGKWNKSTNEQEANEVINVLKENHNDYKSIIILAFNIKQKQLIEDKLTNYSKLWTKVLNKEISIRNIENIQGDEADLVIISVVYTWETKIMGTYVARKGGRNALNVAFSRAKSKMIVIKSVSASTLANGSGQDYETLRKWLEFLDYDKEFQREYSLKEIKRIDSYSQSNFEENVYNKLLKKLTLIKNNYKLVQQFPIGSKKIDIAIVDENNNYILGIEVDGYKYHSTPEQYLSDISREKFIKAKGYDLTRIKDINWYLNPNKEIKRIQEIINNKIQAMK